MVTSRIDAYDLFFLVSLLDVTRKITLFTFDKGDVYPRVTRCLAKQAAFTTLENALGYISKNKVVEPKEVIKDGGQHWY